MLQLFSQCRIWVHLIRIRSSNQFYKIEEVELRNLGKATDEDEVWGYFADDEDEVAAWGRYADDEEDVQLYQLLEANEDHAVHGDLDAIRRSMAAGDQLVMESAFNDHSPDLHDWIAENSLSPNLFEIAPSVTSVQAGAAKRSHQVGWRWRLTDPLGSYVSVPIPASCRVSACRATDWSFGRGRF